MLFFVVYVNQVWAWRQNQCKYIDYDYDSGLRLDKFWETGTFHIDTVLYRLIAAATVL